MLNRRLAMTLVTCLLTCLVPGCADPEEAAPQATLGVRVQGRPERGERVCYDVVVRDAAGTVVHALGDPERTLLDGDRSALCSEATNDASLPAAVAVDLPCADGVTYTVGVRYDGRYATDAEGSLFALTEYDAVPCAEGCELTATCGASQNAEVMFDLFPLRMLYGGSEFLVGDMIGGARVDCRYDDGEPQQLLVDPRTGTPGQTVALRLGALLHEEAEGSILIAPVVIECGGVETILDLAPSGEPAFTADHPDPDPGDAIWQHQVNAGVTGAAAPNAYMLSGPVLYWNLAIGFDPATPDCTLRTRSAFGPSALLADFGPAAGASYAWLDYSIRLTGPQGGLVCALHDVGDDESGITVRYSDIARGDRFCHRFDTSGSFATDPRCTDAPAGPPAEGP